MELIKEMIRNGDTKLDVYGVGYPTHKIVEIEKSGITGDYVGVQTDDREFKLVPVKRNKQVDVPTEAWQKNVERNLAYANNTIVPLIAYLSRHHGLDISKFNEWKQEYLDAIK